MQVLADEARVQTLVEQLVRWVAGLPQDRGPDTATGGPTESASGLALIGIRDRGDVLAARVGQRLGVADVGRIDITLYRDDLTEIATQPVVRATEVDFAIDGRDVVLIDDVLMSGRSVRAALSVLMDLGRPRRVWLAVLVDRGTGYRELPIAPDFVGLSHEGPQRVRVQVRPTDGRDAVLLEDGGGGS